MKKHQGAYAGSEKGTKKKEKLPEEEIKEGDRESCRCKEVAKKTPREMLKLVINDMSFWKKPRKKNS